MLIKDFIYDSLSEIYPSSEAKSLAMIITKDILKLSELESYTGKYINLSADNKQILENILLRLKQFEPIQYIQGYTFFYGYKFLVAPGVLIPRPETEELVELVISETPHGSSIVDIGAGSGCIAITLAKKVPQSKVEGWDVSDKALNIAQKNNSLLNGGVSFRHEDILRYTPGLEKFDVIVSNPPYVTMTEKQQMHKNVLNWEPESALFVPDEDPLLFYRKIAETGRDILKLNGRIYFEINQYYSKETVRLLEGFNYKDIRLIKDLFGNDRIIAANL